MLTDLDGDCMPIGVTLRWLTDVHLDKLKRLYLVDTFWDAGCRDLLHLGHALEVSTWTSVATVSSTGNFGYPSVHSRHSRSSFSISLSRTMYTTSLWSSYMPFLCLRILSSVPELMGPRWVCFSRFFRRIGPKNLQFYRLQEQIIVKYTWNTDWEDESSHIAAAFSSLILASCMKPIAMSLYLEPLLPGHYL